MDPFVHLHTHTEYCLDPQTRIITADLQWIPAAQVQEGDLLIGFGEDLRGGNSKMEETIVEKVSRVVRDCYRITLETGETIVASAQHGWVTCGPGPGYREAPNTGPVKWGSNSRKWTDTNKIIPGKSKLILWASPWDEIPQEYSREVGYLSGLIDGEGWLNHTKVGFAQNEGPVLDEALRIFNKFEYNGSLRPQNGGKGNCYSFTTDGYATSIRLLAQIRPIRLFPRHKEIWLGRKPGGNITRPVLVVGLEHVGEMETVAIQTSTKTLIAEGYLSHNSILDGAAKLDDLVEAAVQDGAPAISSTDHGNMYGSLEFYKKCKKAGLKYIPGEEFYMAAESVEERPNRSKAKLDDSGGETQQGKKLYYHITLLAETNEGFSNLIKLSSRAFLEGYYYKPRVDWEMLSEHSRGVIATSGCLGGVVLQDLLHDNVAGAREKAGRLQEIFGQENFFIELQNHDLPEQHKTNPMLMDIANYLKAPLLATNDCHYVHRHDAASHDSLLCIQTNALRSDEKRFKFTGEEHYLKTAAEMRYLFSEVPDACDNTLWVAERSNVSLENTTGYKLPKFKVPAPFADDNEYLKMLVYHGASQRWGDILPLVQSRLEYELGVIKDMGFPSYFLILWDIVRHAKENNILTGPGRGSAAGCAVAYCLGITKIDPIKYDLLFERFLNPSRISMPDIDLDMDSRYRDDLIRYASDIYGDDHVAQVITFGQIKARAAVRGAARVLGLPFSIGSDVVVAMPKANMGRVTSLKDCLDPGNEVAKGVRQLYDDPDYQEVIDIALGLEGLRQNDSIHAAAVVISDSPLSDYLPIQRKGEGKPIVTQYEMNNVEELGLLKMDFLSLRNLDTMDIACKLILKIREEIVDIDNLDLEDESTFKILRNGDTFGVFQLEGSPMRDLLRRLNPESIHDVAAVVALYRPGPMASNMHNDYADRKNGRQNVSYFHEDAQEILKDTYGLMIYQEQMMRIAQRFAGYSLAEADNLRKACGKKIRELMAKEKDKLINGIILSGYTEELAHYIWDMIEPFADYSFNKSHAYAYGFISYATAYLKANYPIEFMCALLSSNMNDPEKTSLYLGECRKLGIEILLPDVNSSEAYFQPKDGKILFGLTAMKDVGAVAVEEIIKCRKNQPFVSLGDFGERMSEYANKTVIQALIEGGALDAFGGRKSMIEAIPDVQKTAKRLNKEKATGTMSLFDMPSTLKIDSRDFEPAERIALERGVLGTYISDHPLNRVVSLYRDSWVTIIPELVDCFSKTSLVGLVTKVKHHTTKKGDAMAFFTLEDLYSDIEVIVFPKDYKRVSHLLTDNSLVKVMGQVDHKEESLKFIAQQITSITTVVEDE